MSRHRKRERVRLSKPLNVIDEKTGDLLGTLADLSDMGIMILSGKPISPHTFFHIYLELPELIVDRREIEFDALSLWCRDDLHTEKCTVGLQILNILPEDVLAMEILIEKFRDAPGTGEIPAA